SCSLWCFFTTRNTKKDTRDTMELPVEKVCINFIYVSRAYMLSIRHEVFIDVANHLSFLKAAEILFISQPAISKHIKTLEQYYKTTLFDRSGNSIVLTNAGRLLYNHLLKAKAIQKQLEFDISTINSQLKAKGQLKLGASTT